MNTSDAATWVLSGEDHFVIFGNKVCKGPVYSQYKYIPVIRVGGDFYHLKYIEGVPTADYNSRVYVDEKLNICE